MTAGQEAPGAAERACFEAGIKFGSLYHQFAGTPISPASASDLSTAMASSIENQPHCRRVTVDVDGEALRAAVEASAADYVELTGQLFEAEIVVAVEDVTVVARMAMEGGYPRMRITSIDRDSDC